MTDDTVEPNTNRPLTAAAKSAAPIASAFVCISPRNDFPDGEQKRD
jgi:hypothetical protein